MFARRGSQGETGQHRRGDDRAVGHIAHYRSALAPGGGAEDRRIAFVSSRDHLSPSVFVMNADGTNVTRLSPAFRRLEPDLVARRFLIAYESSTADTACRWSWHQMGLNPTVDRAGRW